MRALLGWTFVGCALALGAPLASAQDKPKAEVMHWWTSGGESAAVKVFADQFTKAGGEWVDTAVAGGEAARAAAISRMVGGNPPTAMQFNTGSSSTTSSRRVSSTTSTSAAEEGKWETSCRPPSSTRSPATATSMRSPSTCTARTGCSGRRARSTRPASQPPKTWDEFFAALDKLKAAGLVPIALGGQPWQERSLFNTIMLDEGRQGRLPQDLWREDEEAIKIVRVPEGRRDLRSHARLCRSGLPRPQLERRHRHADHRQGRRAVHGRLGQGRVQAAGKAPARNTAASIGLGRRGPT